MLVTETNTMSNAVPQTNYSEFAVSPDPIIRQLHELHTLVQPFILTQKRTLLLDGIIEYLKNTIPNSSCAVYSCGEADKPERLAWYGAVNVPVPGHELAVESAYSMTPFTERSEAGFETRRVSPIIFQSRAIGAVDIIKPLGMTPQESGIYQLALDYISNFWVLYDLMALMEEEAYSDPLTGIWNRRYMLRRFQDESDRIARYNGSACVMMADMGNFKQINDRFGHAKGDEILIKVAGALKKCLRVSDCVGRYGGDEFLLLLHNTSQTNADIVIARINKALESLRVKGADGTEIDVILDFGVSAFPGKAPTLMDAIKLADEDMFANKNARKMSSGIPITREGVEYE